MKQIKTFAAVLVALIINGCSNEEVKPQFEQDMVTSSMDWMDNYLIIDITTSEGENAMEFQLSGTGSVTVDWGDGTSEEDVVLGQYVTFRHTYEDVSDYQILITGDLAKITELGMAYISFPVWQVHLDGLINLEHLAFDLLNQGPREINLSQNRKLKSLVLSGIQPLENVIVPSTNQLTTVDITGANSLTTPVVDRIISRVRDSVVKNPRAGAFNLSKGWWQDENNPEMVGPPSSYSINKLKMLRDVYGWLIIPYLE